MDSAVLPSGGRSVVNNMELHYQTRLCEICSTAVRPKEAGDSLEYMASNWHTRETFLNAVEEKCIICSVVWETAQCYEPHEWHPAQFDIIRNKDMAEIAVTVVAPGEIGFSLMPSFILFPVDSVKYQEQLVFPAIQADASYDVKLSTAKDWLHQCLSSHPHCKQFSSPSRNWHPTRLIDIGEKDSINWRLHVVSEDGTPSPSHDYLTLSYCWGPGVKHSGGRATLLSSNIAELRLGSPISDLPALLRDFISIARHLSIRYVWIDCFCIMQDSEEDWNAEASAMHLVYSNSICTVAASNCASPDESLFQNRNMGMILPGLVESSLFSAESRTCCLIDREYWNRQFYKAPLQNRGWALQERYLASRVLYFSTNQLLWDCRSCHRCEVFPKGIPTHVSERSMDKVSQVKASGNKTVSLDRLEIWNYMIGKYSNYDLTYPSDKLLAIAGIAKRFRGNTNDRYLAGIWSSDQDSSLDWDVFSPRPRPSYRAPSWSWASVDGEVRLKGSLSAGGEALAQLVDIDVTTKFPDEMSAVLDGFVLLKCRAIPATIQKYPESAIDVSFCTEAGKFNVRILFDTLDDRAITYHRVVYVPFSIRYGYDKEGVVCPHLVCLLLVEMNQEPVDEVKYRRIGLFTVDKESEINSFNANVESQMIKIV
ncbi:hypothetical protein GLAREA_04698 [Glarea lozoyensis ATCC 20868]|uniref:Heterokaryon incompatibility domain-containing protein n=1 Tax=Glarea lozoyensis (strain ATCC 20868 / MF5171) TaxID=1116229 RepID=S3CN61_GLAL2|nr:uncharacterized protein GLAREA_04698 [Glarea lozoyensis ATCC 20868]EPE27907.1 hypothetical protein GLAREA_04698 [Glarea lozoyensis ATCC 20868]